MARKNLQNLEPWMTDDPLCMLKYSKLVNRPHCTIIPFPNCMANDELFYSDEYASNTLLIRHTIEDGSPNMCVWERGA